ncbi:hypothetical protein FQA39_LY09180 [Lamprigera yunnana]|nr:hypothetical protein FQA39_LY09180 [Lamprigera yunnana]
MWMLYAQEHWTKALDLKSAVERIYEELGALEFDADHEEIYEMKRYYTVQQCEEHRDKYKIGRKVGELRLMSEFDLQWLPPSYLNNNKKSTEITEALGKLPLNIRNNEEMKTYLLCTKHWNLPSWECHFDGPPTQKRMYVQCNV